MSLRQTGKTNYLYIGRGSGNEGVWLGDEKPESFLRKRDAFLEYFRKFLSATQFDSIELDSSDRILTILYRKWGVNNKLSLFYKGRKLYFAHLFYSQKQEGMQVFKSWAPNSKEISSMNTAIFDEVGRKDLSEKNDSDKQIIGIESLLAEERRLALKSPVKKKSEKFVKRKIDRIKGDLNQVKLWGELQELAMNEDDFSTYDKKSKVSGIKINFKENDHFKRRNEVFEKIKKLKKAEGILKKRLADTKTSDSIPKVEVDNSLSPVKPYWNQKEKVHPSESSTSTSGSYKIFNFEGFQVGIGQSAIGNDELRKNWGKKDDIWFHLEDVKSPHIICKLNAAVLDELVLQIIASIMIEYSEFSFTEANLIYTQVKNLKGVKGAAGKVTFKKEKHVKIVCIDNWKQYCLT